MHGGGGVPHSKEAAVCRSAGRGQERPSHLLRRDRQLCWGLGWGSILLLVGGSPPRVEELGFSERKVRD